MVKIVVVLVGQIVRRCVTVITMSSAGDPEMAIFVVLAPDDENVAAGVVRDGNSDCDDGTPCWLVTYVWTIDDSETTDADDVGTDIGMSFESSALTEGSSVLRVDDIAVGASKHFQRQGAISMQANPSLQGHIADAPLMQAPGLPSMDVV